MPPPRRSSLDLGALRGLLSLLQLIGSSESRVQSLINTVDAEIHTKNTDTPTQDLPAICWGLAHTGAPVFPTLSSGDTRGPSSLLLCLISDAAPLLVIVILQTCGSQLMSVQTAVSFVRIPLSLLEDQKSTLHNKRAHHHHHHFYGPQKTCISHSLQTSS